MNVDLIQKMVVCLACKGELSIKENLLYCKACASSYRFIDGWPEMLLKEKNTSDFNQTDDRVLIVTNNPDGKILNLIEYLKTGTKALNISVLTKIEPKITDLLMGCVGEIILYRGFYKTINKLKLYCWDTVYFDSTPSKEAKILKFCGLFSRTKKYAIFDSRGRIKFFNRRQLIGKAVRKILGYLNPLKHGPLGALQQRYKVRFYKRCIYDRKLATAFANRYLLDEKEASTKKVLDLGCGQGAKSAILSQLGFFTIGLDLEAHNFWKRINNNSLFLVADAHFLPFPDNYVDTVLSFLMLEYCEDDKKVIKEIKRVMKNNGRLIIQVANKTHLLYIFRKKMIDAQHLREYMIEDISSLIKNEGFLIEKIFTEKFYSPIFTQLINYIFSITPPAFGEFLSNITPWRHRGAINVIAKKAEN